MNPPMVGKTLCRPAGFGVSILTFSMLGLTACGGADSPGEASSAPSEGQPEEAAATSAAAPATAPLGTGFFMMSGESQLHLTEDSYLEESDCLARVSALGDAEEYAGCMEVPAEALCIQLAEGTRESDKWWECFVEEAGCEEAVAAHEVVREVGGYVREILQECEETEMVAVFGSM